MTDFMRKGKIPKPIKERFFEKVRKTNDCWIWTAQVDSSGYGRFGIGSRADKSARSVVASRASWMLHYGEIPEGKFICHTCDNRLCVNPDHLFIGDAHANMKDMVAKKRSLTGIKNPTCKHSENDVHAIRALCDTGRFTQAEIGRMFDINLETVGRIHRRLNWQHL